MVGSISDFPKLFTSMYENLSPGGWVEMQDYYVKLQAGKRIPDVTITLGLFSQRRSMPWNISLYFQLLNIHYSTIC